MTRTGPSGPLRRNSPDEPPVARAAAIRSSTRASTNASSVVRPRRLAGGRRRMWRGRVRELDPAVVVESDDPDSHQVGQVGGVGTCSSRSNSRFGEPVAEATSKRRKVCRRIVVRLGARPRAEECGARRGDESPTIDRDADRDREADREQPGEGEEDPVHSASSIAHPHENAPAGTAGATWCVERGGGSALRVSQTR
jgi:hypothetical protein